MSLIFSVVIYDGIRRRACANRAKPIPAIGVTNLVFLPERRYIFFADIDGSIPESMPKQFDEYILVQTKKGYHFIGFEMLTWKQLNSLWTKWKSYLDTKWVNLQRKARKEYGAILRIAGKYVKHDIEIVELNCDIWYWWCCRYIKLMRLLKFLNSQIPCLLKSGSLRNLIKLVGVYCAASVNSLQP